MISSKRFSLGSFSLGSLSLFAFSQFASSQFARSRYTCSRFTCFLVACTVLLSGCASVATNSEPVNPSQSAIAQDFVHTMSQIDSLDPSSTVLHFQPLATSGASSSNLSKGYTSKGNNAAANPNDCVTEFFAPALKLAATERGYRVRTAYSVPGNISFSVGSVDKENPQQGCVYNVSVGKVDFRRVYQLKDNGVVVPRQSMLVRGADVSHVESDDSFFNFDNNIASSGIANKTSEFDSPVARNDIVRREANAQRNAAEEELLVAKPAKSLETATLSPDDEAAKLGLKINSISNEDAAIEVSETSVRNSNGFVNVRKKNIAELGLSNFEEELADKKNVAEEILIFGDDSYVLGARNKQLLGAMVDSFNPETDVVSVVGCSTGVTQIEHGNAALAIGRANRVKEALLYSGVPHDKIFEEGCWSPTPNSTPFPNRGVVITVKRAADVE